MNKVTVLNQGSRQTYEYPETITTVEELETYLNDQGKSVNFTNNVRLMDVDRKSQLTKLSPVAETNRLAIFAAKSKLGAGISYSEVRNAISQAIAQHGEMAKQYFNSDGVNYTNKKHADLVQLWNQWTVAPLNTQGTEVKGVQAAMIAAFNLLEPYAGNDFEIDEIVNSMNDYLSDSNNFEDEGEELSQVEEELLDELESLL